MKDEKVFLVYTKETTIHKVRANNKEDAIKKYEDGHGFDSIEVRSRLDKVLEEYK